MLGFEIDRAVVLQVYERSRDLGPVCLVEWLRSIMHLNRFIIHSHAFKSFDFHVMSPGIDSESIHPIRVV